MTTMFKVKMALSIMLLVAVIVTGILNVSIYVPAGLLFATLFVAVSMTEDVDDYDELIIAEYFED